MRKFLSLIMLLALPFAALANSIQKMSSPSGNLSADVKLMPKEVVISLKSNGENVVEVQTLRYDLAKEITEGAWQLTKETTLSNRETWKPIYGERSVVPDNYNQTTLDLCSDGNQMKMQVVIRLYDEGLAFKYSFDELDFWNATILKENTQFNFESNCDVWATKMSQGPISKQKINSLEGDSDRPILINVKKDMYVALGEAALVDYARMKMKKGDKANSLISSVHGKVALDLANYETPWRYVMVGKNPGELLENNYLLMNLNAPNAIKDCSWIKPGKVLREVTLTDQGSYACIDFAAANNIEYVEFDAGWYGHEFSKEADASAVNLDLDRSKGPFNLEKIIEYANSKNIGILLYVNMNALRKQLDQVLPIYKKWGIKGVKYGFVTVGDQYHTSWLHHAVRKAAKYELMVDMHDDYRPTGYSRTYPNLMSQEGIRGDEESPSVQHSIYTLFTRMICGAGDNTNCYFAERTYSKMGGKTAQMAKAISIYSPWQFIYWYDRPEGSPRKAAGAGGAESIIVDAEDTDFYDNLPTVWDDIKVLESDVEAHSTIARRSGNNWYIGSLNSGDAREVALDLSFLNPASSYEATIYYQKEADKDPKKNRTRIRKVELKDARTLTQEVTKNGGFAVVIKPIG